MIHVDPGRSHCRRVIARTGSQLSAGLLAGFLGICGALADAPGEAPLPSARPHAVEAVSILPKPDDDADRTATSAARDAGQAVPVPSSRPDRPAEPDTATAHSGAGGLAMRPPPMRPAVPPKHQGEAPSDLPAEVPTSGPICGDDRLLGKRRKSPAKATPPCGIEQPALVERVAGVALSPPALIGCATARRLADWVGDTLRPAALAHLSAAPIELRVFAGFACRPRNNRKGARVSEHGFGRAIDIGGVTLADGRRVSVEANWGSGRPGAFLKALHRGACARFSTVLGPGSDAHHDTHFHFDTAPRRGSAYCR